MVCVNSNEKLILQHLLSSIEGQHRKPVFFYSESDNSTWLEMETWLDKMKDKSMEEELTYYYITSCPISVVDNYANIKILYLLAKGFVTKKLNLQIVISLSNNDILEAELIEKLAVQLHKQIADLTIRRPAPFELCVSFNFVYNVFGESRFTETFTSNEIQQFINIQNESETTYLSIDPSITITGTDVSTLCEHLLLQSHTARELQVAPLFKRDLVRLPSPVALKDIVMALNRGTFDYDTLLQETKGQIFKKASFSKFADKEGGASLVSQILSYIKPAE